MSENNTRKRALYIENITSRDYMDNYMTKHVDSKDFSYIVFTYNINGTVHPWNRHGDIFYDGHKITYINDVCHTDIITDENSHYLAYFNHEGALDFAQSYIYVEHDDNHIRDIYSLYNILNPNVTLTHWTNFRDFVDFNITEDDGWNIDIEDDEIVTDINDDVINISSDNITTSKHFTVSYNYHIGEFSYSDIYNVNFNIYDPITEVEFLDIPSYLDCGQIYTPKIKVKPVNMLSYKGFSFSASNDNVDINETTGRFVCIRPGSFTIKCTYDTGEINSNVININKINNVLSISSTYTSYIYDAEDENYTYTVCYVHSNPENIDTLLSVDFLSHNGISTNLLSNSSDKYIRINNNNTNAPEGISGDVPGIYTISVTVDDNTYLHTNSSFIVTAEQELPNTTILWFKPLTFSDDGLTMTGVIIATSETGEMIDSNYIFNTSGKYDNFTINEIVYDNTYTYTYITANIVNNADSGIIQIQTTDGSFISYTTEIFEPK